ncbi:MAG: hypothetical protein JJE21_04810 [Spirochaetaceae bacterium]|nr:hypothetical protein [Spirochaetaceae bacterium]
MKDNITNEMIEELYSENNATFYSLGSLSLSYIYNSLGIGKFINSQPGGFDDNSSNILKLIIYSKVLLPYASRINYFEDMDSFNDKDVYHFTNLLPKINEDLISYINTQIVDKMDRDTSDIVCLRTDDVLIIVDNDGIPLYYMQRVGTTRADLQELLLEFELIYEEEDIRIVEAPKYIRNLFDLSLKNEDVFDSKEKFIAYYLISYVTLVLLRILANKLGKKYKLKELAKSLEKSVILTYDDKSYKNLYKDKILIELQNIMNIPYEKKILLKKDIDQLKASVDNRIELNI